MILASQLLSLFGVPSPTYKKGPPAVELKTFNFATPGADVPIPTVPSLVIFNLSEPAVTKPMVSVSKSMYVFVSPA